MQRAANLSAPTGGRTHRGAGQSRSGWHVWSGVEDLPGASSGGLRARLGRAPVGAYLPSHGSHRRDLGSGQHGTAAWHPAQHARHRPPRREPLHGDLLARRPQGRRGTGPAHGGRGPGPSVAGTLRAVLISTRRAVFRRRLPHPGTRCGPGPGTPVRQGVPGRPAGGPVVGASTGPGPPPSPRTCP